MIGANERPLGAALAFDDCAAVGRLDVAGWRCSGVLVHPRIVVTVAHGGPRGGGVLPRAVMLRVADLRDATGSETIEGRFVGHEAFTARGSPFDIAVMILERASSVPPAALADTAEIAAAAEVTMAGFGCEREEKFGLRFRRTISAPIHFFGDRSSPRESLAAVRFMPELEFLAGTEEGGPCFGDSGGPVYITAGGVRKLAGIISRPAARQRPFCKGLMILTRIDAFRTWIEARIP